MPKIKQYLKDNFEIFDTNTQNLFKNSVFDKSRASFDGCLIQSTPLGIARGIPYGLPQAIPWDFPGDPLGTSLGDPQEVEHLPFL